MSETVSARLQKELHENLVSKCNDLGCTVNDYIKNAVESKLEGSETVAESFNMENVFEHMKNCKGCLYAMLDKGYALVSLEELKMHNLVPTRNSV